MVERIESEGEKCFLKAEIERKIKMHLNFYSVQFSSIAAKFIFSELKKHLRKATTPDSAKTSRFFPVPGPLRNIFRKSN